MKLDFKHRLLIQSFIASEDDKMKYTLAMQFILDGHVAEWNAFVMNQKHIYQETFRAAINKGIDHPIGRILKMTPELANEIATEVVKAMDEEWRDFLITPEKEQEMRKHFEKYFQEGREKVLH